MFKPPVAEGEVLVYKDWCDECVCVHLVEHWPGGMLKCQGTIKQDPAYYQARSIADIQVYRIKYSASLNVQLPEIRKLEAIDPYQDW